MFIDKIMGYKNTNLQTSIMWWIITICVAIIKQNYIFFTILLEIMKATYA